MPAKCSKLVLSICSPALDEITYQVDFLNNSACRTGPTPPSTAGTSSISGGLAVIPQGNVSNALSVLWNAVFKNFPL